MYGNVHALRRYQERIRRYLDAVHGDISTAEREELRRELRIDRLLEDLGPLIDGTLEGAERVSDLVQDLRRVSSGQRGAREALNLTEIIRSAVQWAAKGARTPVATDLHLPEELAVMGYSGQLHQVMVNIVQNALDAVAEVSEPRVEITAGKEQDQVCIVFRDNGPGIPEADLLRVFDPFYTTKPVGQGTGLGLSISYGIVKATAGPSRWPTTRGVVRGLPSACRSMTAGGAPECVRPQRNVAAFPP